MRLQPSLVLYLDMRIGLSELYAPKLHAPHVVDILDTSLKAKASPLQVRGNLFNRSETDDWYSG